MRWNWWTCNTSCFTGKNAWTSWSTLFLDWIKEFTRRTGSKEKCHTLFPIHVLRLGTTRSWKVFLYPFILLHWVFQARKVLLEQKAELIFCKWWPWSLSVWIASWLLMIPLWIHESDSVPGRSNRILWRFAQKIFLGFNTSWKYFQEKKITVSWQILHPDIEKPAKNLKSGRLKKSCARNMLKSVIKECFWSDFKILW